MNLGDALPPVEATADPAAMKTMAALLRDPNMIHLDPAVAESLGFGRHVVVQGPILMGWVYTMLVRAAGGADRVLDTRFRFRQAVFGGERVVAGGEVTAITSRRGRPELGNPRGRRGPVAGQGAAGPGDVVECSVWLDVHRPAGPVRALSGTARLKG